jgi:hypothetical protein
MNATISQPPSGPAPIEVRTHSADDIRMARRWAGVYRRRGYNPIPSRPEEKRPFIRWSEYLDREFPAAQFERFDTGSMQLMTGRRWGLVVIDLDGPEAIAHWPSMGKSPARTWVTHSGGDGQHHWFAVPTSGPAIPSGRLWGIWDDSARDGRGDWAKHKAVEILADRKLVMVPPSIHPTTGRRYRFVGGHSPKDIPAPAPLPRWVLGLPRLAAPRPAVAAIPIPEAREKAPNRPATGRFDWKAVLYHVADKIAVAQAWGLRFASTRPNPSGWCSCHRIGRDDRTPSASFHAESGRYWEADAGSIGFFEVGVRLGHYLDWREAVADLGERHHVPRMTA